MSALRRSATWPQLVAISLIGVSAASCSADSGRFSEGFGSNNSSSRSDVTGSIPQTAPANHVESRPLPHLATADDGSSGGGRGMGSYQPNGDVTGSIPAAPPPPAWTWEGGTPITVGPGETLEGIARQHGVPVSAIMEANNITSPATVYPGEHLVIPRYRSSAAAATAPETRIASTEPAAVGAPRGGLVAPPVVHVVAPGETLNSIARLYRKPVAVVARANNLAPDARVRVGDRIVIPDVRERAAPVASRIDAPAASTGGSSLATVESPHSARLAAPTAPAVEDDPVKAATAASDMPSFRWPVRGRIIAAFGPEAEWLAERWHQSRGAGGHADQGGRGWRCRLCRQRA